MISKNGDGLHEGYPYRCRSLYSRSFTRKYRLFIRYLYLVSAETALQQVLIPEHVCCTAPYWVIGYKLPKPIQNQQELESLFTWHNFFTEFASNADEFKEFNPRGE